MRWLGVALAATAWLLDWHRVVYAPDSVLQLHALWHLASAPTVLALYANFRSERPRVTLPAAEGRARAAAR